MAKRLRTLSTDSQQVRDTYADLLDFYSEPARKAAFTRKKNQQQDNEQQQSEES